MTKVIYIAGPITGIPEYYKPFEAAMDEIQAAGMIPLNPCWQPEGMDRTQYTRICMAMMDCADAVLFLPGWEHSRGCKLEMEYCLNTDKLFVCSQKLEDLRDRAEKLVFITGAKL